MFQYQTNQKDTSLEKRASVRDVNSLTDMLGKGIDEKIKPLVQAVWNKGYDTTQSCEGHSDWGRRYPFVDFAEATNDLDKLRILIEEYNNTQMQKPKPIRWKLMKRYWDQDLNCDTYELSPVDGVNLEDAQKNIKELAEHISPDTDLFGKLKSSYN